MGYSCGMFEIRKTANFADWLDNLTDIRARARVLVRIERLAGGLISDAKSVGDEKDHKHKIRCLGTPT